MRRLFWMALGAGATVYVLRRSKAGLQAFLPSPFTRNAAGNAGTGSAASNALDGLATDAADFIATFRSAQREREAELRAAVLNEKRAAYDPDDRRNPRSSDPDELIYEF